MLALVVYRVKPKMLLQAKSGQQRKKIKIF